MAWYRTTQDPTAETSIAGATVIDEGDGWLVHGEDRAAIFGLAGRGYPCVALGDDDAAAARLIDVDAAQLQAARAASTDREKAAALDALLDDLDGRTR